MFFHAESGRIVSAGGTIVTSRLCPAAPLSAGDATATSGTTAAQSGGGHLPPLSVDAILNLLRAVRIPTQIELTQERLTPGSTFGDPMLRTARAARESFDVKVDAVVDAFLTRTIALLAAAMWALQALPEAQKATLPLVDVGRVMRQSADTPMGGGAVPAARIGLVPCVAAALTAAVTTMGLATFGAHANACAPMWRHATAPGLAWDASGRPQPVNFFWSTVSRMAAMDEAALVPTALYRVSESTDDALAPITGGAHVKAHGADASILAFAARLGLLRSARLDAAAHAPLALLWSTYHGALMAAAEASRKECRTLLGPATTGPHSAVAARPAAAGLPAGVAATAGHLTGGGRGNHHAATAGTGRGRFNGGRRGSQPAQCPHCKKHHAGPCWHQSPAGGRGPAGHDAK